MVSNYSFCESSKIRDILEKVTLLNKQIQEHKNIDPELWKTIQKKLKFSWTYNSNAIEGNTLSEGETIFFLEYGLTVEGKPFKDFLETRNHAEAIDYLMEVIKDDREITESLIKELNALLLSGVKSTEARNEQGQKVKKPATPGLYKKLPNHVLQLDGTIYYYVEPIHVQTEMENLCSWIHSNIDKFHPTITCAIAHYNFVRIHPFDDGNGRGARILMNLILMKKKYPPAIVRNERRRHYIESLSAADKGNLEPFILFIGESLVQTENTIIQELERASKSKSPGS